MVNKYRTLQRHSKSSAVVFSIKAIETNHNTKEHQSKKDPQIDSCHWFIYTYLTYLLLDPPPMDDVSRVNLLQKTVDVDGCRDPANKSNNRWTHH